MESVINVYKILVGMSVGKTALGRPSCGEEDNIKVDLQEMEYENVGWIHVA
jgi:hypothetical protein